MTLRHLSYVSCSWCGASAKPGNDYKEARANAEAEGFLMWPGNSGADMCPSCKEPQRRRRTNPARPSESSGGLSNSREDH